ncbi:phosphotransferase [Halorubellus sp. PRR65]|uniref:phosphotransferase family protein n=1 Tax=Halorubellus sp. PRR65 TaxID=3098148 RepID=UPI002B2618C2|nr:phosphotransferase [Halorubellus sp. PRR65]
MTDVEVPAVVDPVLAAVFPDREVAAAGDAGPSWNDDNRTVGVEFADGERAYCKVAVDGDPSRAARECGVLAYVDANAVVPTPAVLASATGSAADPPYVVTADVDGTIGWRAWRDADDDERVAFARAVGRTFASVHACRFDAHGRVVDGDANDLDVDPVPWPDLLADQIRWSRDRAGGGRFDDHYDDVLALVDDERDRLRDAPAALCHGDPARPNQFVHAADATDSTSIGDDTGSTSTTDSTDPTSATAERAPTVGLLDWELAHVGDPVRELQRARRQFVDSRYDPGTERHAQAFYDGYRDRAGGLPDGFEDRRRIYDAVTYLGVTGFFERWADDFDTPTDELAAEVADEMDRRLAAAREH